MHSKKKGTHHGFQILQIRNFHPGNTSSGSPENPPGSRCRTYRDCDSCMSSSEVIGYWRPLEGCNPYIGNEGEISKEPEVKVEVTVFTEAVDRTIEAIKKVHPYEEPVINAIPILRTSF